MLRAMRKHAKFFYILFFIIILTFIFWGVGPLDQPTAVPVAEIGKEKITLEEYGRAYDRTVDFYRDMYKEKFNDEMEKKLKLREKALDSLIDERALLIAAGSIGMTVSDEELEEAIMNEPGFTRNGVFDRDIYMRALQLNRLTPEYFENIKRYELTLLKMTRLIGEAFDITDDESRYITGDEQTAKAFRQALLFDKREKAVKSYVEGIKKQIKIKVNNHLIS
ncbi:MAG: SurA N-terminal domain-containing protein [Nitrospirota bacterium]|nr:SurA N-terminal domain-containing protein [Nitrospirota bacterium]